MLFPVGLPERRTLRIFVLLFDGWTYQLVYCERRGSAMFDEDIFTIEYRQGDLLELDVEGIVCNVNVELKLTTSTSH